MGKGQNLQSITSNGDVWVSNSRLGLKTTNKQNDNKIMQLTPQENFLKFNGCKIYVSIFFQASSPVEVEAEINSIKEMLVLKYLLTVH